MKTTRNFSTLLRFNLKTAPVVWVFFAFNIALVIIFNSLRGGEYSGFGTAGAADFQMVFYSLMIGMLFYNEGKTSAGGAGSFTPVPHGEFLLTRPVSRRDAWLARASLCLVLMLAPPFLNLCFAMSKPDLRFSLYQDATRHTEAAEKLALYQAAFPGSTVMRDPGASHDTLLVPSGHLLAAGWEFLMVVVTALGLQILVHLALSAKNKSFIFFGGIFLLFVLPIWMEASADPAFFLFVRHWGLAAIATIAIVCLVQWFTCKRAGELEVI